MLTKLLVRWLLAGSLVATVAVAALLSSDSREFRVRDDCDPATFNAALRPGACNEKFDGDTTFAKFLAEFDEDGQVGAWRFNPDNVGLDQGQRTIFQSRAGEFHTFTKVAAFGGGIVPPLNVHLPAGTQGTRPECGGPGRLAAETPTNIYVPFGSAFAGPKAGSTELPPGTTTWQCCFHPWMRSTITVK